MKKTTNYQLNQWEKTDRILMDDFNADNAIIDAAMAGFGNCKIEFGTYTGDGVLHERTLTFSKKPLMVFLQNNDDCSSAYFLRGVRFGLALPNPSHGSDNLLTLLSPKWDGTTFKWSRLYTEHTPKDMMNENGKTYCYFALMAADETDA